ncbi:hypothetical protein [Tessaracoccus antarcticus]|uniref:Uncharacterized protein n=1 Tax=Tessaracoccus antarcticus TaxID=2479848 RepID=A0A3M0GV66_9ACTN|nr:hypothetical protein [Tessaracoccus antarcticus]RMB61216.1 hypothetical protein EAX62_00635 [Tessaracoccus antarcticus]
MMKRTLSAIALGGLLLAGCSGGTTDVERTGSPASPTLTATTPEPVASGEPVESATTAPIPVSSAPAETTPPVPSTGEPSASSEAPPTATAPPPVSAPPPPSEAVTSAPAGGAWVSMEVTVKTAAEAKGLTQTTADFRAFVAERVSTPDASGCQSEFTVLAFHADGYAAGQDFAPGCGGSQSIWGKVDGKWETLMAMQSVVECTEMADNNIPKGLPDIPCLDAGGALATW